MQTPKIVTARKLEAQVQSVAITAFAPSHDALNSLARIHSLYFHWLPDHDRETARQCSSMLAHISHQRLFRTSLTRRFKIESHWDRDPFARATTCLPSWRVPGNLLAEMSKSLHATSRSSEAKSHVSSELRTYRF